jgi:hypothetical protein
MECDYEMKGIHNRNLSRRKKHFNVEEYIRANCEYPGDWAREAPALSIFNAVPES